LVDRLWPRGLSREAAGVDLWMRDIAPSDGLRRWLSHDPSKWEEFRKRYFRELEGKRRFVEEPFELEKKYGRVTLLYSTRNPSHNNAVALMEFLRLQRGV
jgi:uncharacterized protein YeaO (DUF488 family)